MKALITIAALIVLGTWYVIAVQDLITFGEHLILIVLTIMFQVQLLKKN